MINAKKELWDKLVKKELGARNSRFGRRVVLHMRKKRQARRRAGRRG